jgi:hypothetical protein
MDGFADIPNKEVAVWRAVADRLRKSAEDSSDPLKKFNLLMCAQYADARARRGDAIVSNYSPIAGRGDLPTLPLT